MKGFLPPGVWILLVHQFLEQFAYYGIKSTLVLYLRCQLDYPEDDSTVIYHLFLFGAYFSVIFGILVDHFLGKFKTILLFSMISILGHGLNTIGSMTNITNNYQLRLSINFGGLFLVALGVGGHKPSLMAFAGDQFKLPEETRKFHKFSSLFFVFGSIGGLLSTIIIPVLKGINCSTDQVLKAENCTKKDCTTYPIAFGVSGLMMTSATIVFLSGKSCYQFDNRDEIKDGIGSVFRIIWCGIRNILRTGSCEDWLGDAKDKHDPELVDHVRQLFGWSGLLILYLPLVMFWALFEQQGSSWTLQANNMNGDFLLFYVKPEQMLLLNPLLCLLIVPMLEKMIYPILARVNILTKSLQRIATGGFLTALAFCISGILQLHMDDSDNKVHMAWQIPQYVIITVGAIMVIVTVVVFSYNPEPECFKSLIQAVWLLTIALGNLVTAIQSTIGGLNDDPDDNSESAFDLFLFSGLMVLSMMVFSWLSFRYKPTNVVVAGLQGSGLISLQ